MSQSASYATVQVNGAELENVHKFTYLYSTISLNLSLNPEISKN